MLMVVCLGCGWLSEQAAYLLVSGLLVVC
jgi:hypothetical protein